ncbi:MAG: TetR/AcrR family transcriptional regulator [Burkholderiales bacterium]
MTGRIRVPHPAEGAPDPRARARLPPRARLGSAYKRAKHARRQRDVLDAAAALFREKGFEAATMQEVAQRVGMRPASLYHYLPSKERALEAICRAAGAEFTAQLAAIQRAGGPAREAVRRGIALHLHAATLDYVIAFAFHRGSLPGARKAELNAVAKRYLATWEAIVRRGVRDGTLRHDLDPRTAAVGVVALCNGASGWYVGKPPEALARMTAGLVDLVLGGLAARAR